MQVALGKYFQWDTQYYPYLASGSPYGRPHGPRSHGRDHVCAQGGWRGCSRQRMRIERVASVSTGIWSGYGRTPSFLHSFTYGTREHEYSNTDRKSMQADVNAEHHCFKS